MKALEKKPENRTLSVNKTCQLFDLHRDAYYKFLKRDIRRSSDNQKIIKLVKQQRNEQPRVGTRKLIKMIQPSLAEQDLKIGRDRLFNVLREFDLLIKRKKNTFKTTNSFHRFYKYNNLIKELRITKPNQVWVSDITYIRTVNGFSYLALITDVYSRKIVGYDISDSLELSGCIRALKMALKSKPTNLIHHSDRGIQYCSKYYVELLQNHKVKISMTEQNHCYENAIAERVNGILKDEFFLDQCFFSTRHAMIATHNAISIYNNKRLHLSLKYKTPNFVYQKSA
jgi:transposase InsO family protein